MPQKPSEIRIGFLEVPFSSKALERVKLIRKRIGFIEAKTERILGKI